MARLSDADRNDLVISVVAELSADRTLIPESHQGVRAIVDVFDTNLEATESSIVAVLTPSAKTWLMADTKLARALLIRVLEKRKEVL